MTTLVPDGEIERIVGMDRHPTDHYARADSATRVVSILHSTSCKVATLDLRTCEYSVALDSGITHWIPWTGWRHLLDQPVKVSVFRGEGSWSTRSFLVPDLAAVKVALAARRRACRVCGCTDDNACVVVGQACWWVEADLCSRCRS